MSYQPDPVNKDLVISGFAAGIAGDPYSGPSDMKSIGLESVPNEASVAFATSAISSASMANVTVTSSGSNLINFSGGASGLEQGMAVIFTSISGISQLTLGNVYYVANLTGTPPNSCKLYSDIGLASQVAISDNGTAVFKVFSMADPTNFADDGTHQWLVDSQGNVWTNAWTTTSGKWVFTANYNANNGISAPSGFTHTDGSNGNGLVVYGLNNGASSSQYLFVFSNASVDYMKIQSTVSWVYGWNPNDGTSKLAPGNTAVFTTPLGLNNSHQAITGPDGIMYFCDAYTVSSVAVKAGQTFDPTNPSGTYKFTLAALIVPQNEVLQCIAPLGNNFIEGGIKNYAYSWDGVNTAPSYIIPLSENNVKQIITVNTNAYLFVGNRGRIWITNGSQAQIFKKLPDHISGSVDPLFAWGGACYNWNQLYFGAQAYSNGGTKIANYGGLWAIDLTTGALRNCGQMSYGTYSGNVTALIGKNPATNPPGYGLLMGWDDGNGNSGADESDGAPYTGGQSFITTELIPIGLNLNPVTPSQIEFKLSRPLVVGESVKINVGQYLDPSYASFSACTFNGGQSSFNTAGAISGITDDMPIDKFQWFIAQVVLTSTGSSPSYVRLTELRVKNAAVPITSYGTIQ